MSDNWGESKKVDRIRKLMQVGLLVRCHKVAGISTRGLFQFPSCCWDKCDKMSKATLEFQFTIIGYSLSLEESQGDTSKS